MFGKKQKDAGVVFANDLVGCIGKLPLHMEFIKHRVIQTEIANLDQWYQSAYNHLSRQLGNDIKIKFKQMPLHNFIYTAPRERTPMIGTLIASQDQSDRVYPFVIFRLIENPIAHEFQSIIPLLYKDFFDENEHLCNSHWDNCSLPDLYAKVNQLNQTVVRMVRRDALESVLKALNALTLNDFRHYLTLTYPDVRFESIVQHSLKLLIEIRNSLHKEQLCGLRLPIMNEACVIFWLQLIDVILLEKTNRLQIFWNQRGIVHERMLTVYFKPMPTTCFSQFVNQKNKDETLYDVVQQAKNEINITDKIKTLTQGGDRSLLTVLQQWSKPDLLQDFILVSGHV